ncbi:MAG: endonuclease MutS2 [Dehalococcoidia bacterium]|nr:endonuclease MutS2 [Dehalococcoidia bacterium]
MSSSTSREAADGQRASTASLRSLSEEEQRTKTLGLLEFTAVRERLAGHTSSSLGAELARVLEPSYDTALVERLGWETAEARQLLTEGADLDCSGLIDVRAHLDRAAKAGVLSGVELREVALAFQTTYQVRQLLLRRKSGKLVLAGIAEGIPDLQAQAKAINHAIGRQGEVMDAASSDLRGLRAEVRAAFQRLQDLLMRIARSSLGRHVLQEPVITERNSRPVLLVKSSERSRLPGLVHDVSESGATIFVEPMAAIPHANRLQEARAAETREVDRILRSLSEQVGARAPEAHHALELVAYVDLLSAKARYGAALGALSSPVPTVTEATLRLVEARHPLLFGNVVPLSLALGAGAALQGRDGQPVRCVMLVTGPNAGGKTVALKTVGLLALMHQAGFQLPAAAGTALPVFDAVYADIGDQQSILRSLSSFTAHLTALQEVLRKVTARSLVLLDELGSSTDPEEGAALGKAVLESLRDRGVLTIATTHYRELAAFVQEQSGMVNASVELDPDTLTPTYQLTVGLPGRSYALAIASRLNLDPAVVERARALLPGPARRADQLLEELERERQAAAEARRQAQEALAGAEALKNELRERLDTVEQEKEQMLAQARQELQERVADLLAQVEATEEALKASRSATLPAAAAPAFAQAQQQAARLRKQLRAPQWQPARPDHEAWLKALRPGDPVRVQGFNLDGRVLAPLDEKGMLQVQVGALRIHVRGEQTLPPSSGAKAAPSFPKTSAVARQLGGRPEEELDVRGLRADEALVRLEPFLDQALLHGLSKVRVIHGVGTGALRLAFRERLTGHPAVRSWSPADRSDGSTTVLLT